MTGSAWQLSDAGAYSPIRFYRNSLNRGLFCIPEIFVKHKFSVNSKGRTERRDNETDTISFYCDRGAGKAEKRADF